MAAGPGEPSPDENTCPSSSYILSIPAGVMIMSTVAGVLPSFLRLWPTPRGTKTREPTAALLVRSPSLMVQSAFGVGRCDVSAVPAADTEPASRQPCASPGPRLGR
jgi:hypothetical protein